MRPKSVVVAAVLGVAGVATVAPATAAYDQCNAGNVCIWGNNDFQWLIAERAGGRGMVDLTGEANNQNDSWGNRSTYYAGAYDGKDGTGECSELPEFSKDDNIGFYDADDWSSWRTQYGC